MKQKTILKTQKFMRVTLNGGSYELDDATIPFQIGFKESIAKMKPSYVLVMDITKKLFNESGEDDFSERRLFKLEPVHYLQLTRPGIHHLVFILFGDLSQEDKKFLLEKSTRGFYKNSLYFNSIEQLELSSSQISYCEAIVSVPEDFFGVKPKSGFKKSIWVWVNSWYIFDPIDQCEYRKRMIFALTVKPIIVFLGFLLRLTAVFLWTTVFAFFRMVAMAFGFQPIKLIPNKKKVWYEFLFLYPLEGASVLNFEAWTDSNKDSEHYEECYYPYKTIVIGKRRIYMPITLFGFITLIGLMFFYVDSVTRYSSTGFWAGSLIGLVVCATLAGLIAFRVLPTFKKSESWRDKWSGQKGEGKQVATFFLIFFFLGITHLSFFLIFNGFLGILAISFCAFILSVFLLNPLVKKINIKVKKAKAIKKSKDVLSEEKRKEWLLSSFNLKTLPKKVSPGLMPKPSSAVHRFTVRFWQIKAKACKPYSR